MYLDLDLASIFSKKWTTNVFHDLLYEKFYIGYFSLKILLLKKVLINLHLKTEENFTMMAHSYSTYFVRFFRKIFEKAKYFFRFFRKKNSRKKAPSTPLTE